MNELYELIEGLDACVVGTDGTELPMPVVAKWWRCDPWAVELTFQWGTGVDVVWLIGRDLLYEGLTTSVGEGDVQVYPSGLWETGLRLSSPNGRARISLDEEGLREFLTATFDAVPAGEELLWIPLDQELADLLDGSEL